MRRTGEGQGQTLALESLEFWVLPHSVLSSGNDPFHRLGNGGPRESHGENTDLAASSLRALVLRAPHCLLWRLTPSPKDPQDPQPPPAYRVLSHLLLSQLSQNWAEEEMIGTNLLLFLSPLIPVLTWASMVPLQSLMTSDQFSS